MLKKLIFSTILMLFTSFSYAQGLISSINPTISTIKNGSIQTYTVTLAHPNSIPEVATISVSIDYIDVVGNAYTASASSDLTIVKPYKLKQISIPISRYVVGTCKVNGLLATPNASGIILSTLEINEGQSCVITFGVK